MELLYNKTHNIWNHSVVFVGISTDSGLEVEFMSLGACIRKIALHPHNESERLLTLSYTDPLYYIQGSAYSGMTIGPNAGRIRAINGLSANDGPNQLHGGFDNLSFLNWELEFIKKDTESCCISFTTKQKDGIDGWSGNRTYHAVYSLEETGWLSITYTATTDAPTYVNMTNHTYWNLSSDPSAALSQKLFVFADELCLNDDTFLPNTIQSVSTFLASQSIPYVSKATPPQPLPLTFPWNHAFLLRNAHKSRKPSQVLRLHPAATLTDFSHSITIKMTTDAPALVVYRGDYLESNIPLSNGLSSRPCCAIALEAQEIPSVMEQTLTTPEKPFSRNIRFRISH